MILPPHNDDALSDETSDDARPRVTPLAAPPEWLQRYASASSVALGGESLGEAEEQFWSGSVRDWVSDSAALPPARLASQARKKWATRAALAAAIGVALVVALAVETGLAKRVAIVEVEHAQIK